MLLERLLVPVHRLLLRIRGADLGVPSREPAVGSPVEECLNTVALAIPEELGSAMRQFVEDLPDSVAKTACSVPEWVASTGPGVLDPLGAISSMVFAVVARSSSDVRLG